MILLRDTVEIEASPEQVFNWLAHFQENYLVWHPDHVACRYVKGTSILEVDSILYVEEYLHEQLHKLKLRTTRVIPNSRLEYRAGFGINGAFEVKPQNSNVLFTADIIIGSNFPVFGWCLDLIMQTLFSNRLKALKQHMVEEGENLKKLLERGK